MIADSTAPATKQDVRLIMEHLVRLELRMDGFDLKFDEFSTDIKRHFDVMTEHLTHEYVHGALADKVQQHEDRIVVLERRVTPR